MKSAVLVSLLLNIVIASKPKWMVFPDGDGNPQIITLDDKASGVQNKSVADIQFQLFTKNNPINYTLLVTDDDNSLGNLDFSLPTRLYIHGWMSSASKGSFIKDDYLSVGSYNVIMVDWSALADDLYTTAKDNVKSVGEYTAQLLDYLVKKGLDLSTVNIAGHSLGAHVAGVVGNRISSGTVRKITGLDPAAPLYGDEPLEDRLDKNDAAFVEIIHTCGGILGWEDPMGHADFFPNGGGSIQPGCGLDIGGSCSHRRSHDYFGESITTKVGFVAHVCGSWSDYQAGKCASNPTALMGESTSTSASGSYYLATASSSPYALGS